MQTTRVVCTDFAEVLRIGKALSVFLFAYLETFGYRNKRLSEGLQKDKFYLSFCGALQNAVIARH